MEEGAEGREEGQAGPVDRDLIRDVTPVDPAPLPASAAARIARHRATPSAVVVVVGLLLGRPFWWPGGRVVGFDTYAYSGPNLEVTAAAFRSFRLPLVNDLIFGGVPHLGNPQTAVLYPPNLLAVVFETNRAMGILVTLHLILLGIGMVALSRRLGVGPIGAAAAGVTVMASGAMLVKTVQFEQILVISWAPLLLAAIHAVLNDERPWRPVAATGAVTAAVLLAGHPQLTYQTVILAVVAVAGFVIGSDRWRRLPHLGLGVVLGGLIALPQLLAALLATADSAIGGTRTLDALDDPRLTLAPRSTINALLGTVQDRDPAFFAGGFESIVFVGVVVAIVATIGFVAAVGDRARRPWAIAFGAIGLVALVWAMGPRTIVFRFAFDVLPGFDLARASARWLVVVAIVVALFTGVGVDRVVTRIRGRDLSVAGFAVAVVAVALAVGPFDSEGRVVVLWAVLAGLTLAGLTLAFVAASRRWRTVPRIAVAAVLVVGLAELGAMARHSVPQSLRTDTAFTAHRTATTDYLADRTGSVVALTDDGRPVDYTVPALRPNANVLNGIASIDGYDGGVQVTERWADALRRFTPSPDTSLPLRNSLTIPVEPGAMARLGVRYILLDRQRPAEVFIPGWTGPVATDDLFEVWENPVWLGEGVAWSAATAVDDPAELLRLQPADVARVALVGDADAAIDCAGSPFDCAPRGVELARPQPERIEALTDFDRVTILSVPQQAFAGWSVEIDGVGADVVVVDGLFLGVEVPEGRHEVVFSYDSPWLTATLAVSLAAVAATIALAITGTVHVRRRNPQV